MDVRAAPVNGLLPGLQLHGAAYAIAEPAETVRDKATSHPTAGERDRGAATVWTAGAVAALLAVTTLVVWLGAAAATRHRAAGAADLAALAAAGAAVEGERVACGKARWVTDRMGVVLHVCRLNGADALVEVVAQPPGVLAGFGPAEARARAGPVVERGDASRTVVFGR